jgi:hypothetical protein
MEHNYTKLLMEYFRIHGKPSGVVHANIRHDDWCAIHGGMACDCDPDIDLGDVAVARDGQLCRA